MKPVRPFGLAWILLGMIAIESGCAVNPTPERATTAAAQPSHLRPAPLNVPETPLRSESPERNFGDPPVASNGEGTSPRPSAERYPDVDQPSHPTARDVLAKPSYAPMMPVSREVTYPGVENPLRPLPVSSTNPADASRTLRGRQAQGTVVHANQSTFEDQVLRSDVPVLVDFYASWCGPCRALAPTLSELAAETPQARIVKVDIDAEPELAARYGVASVPNLIVFKDGRVVARQTGVVSKPRMKTMLGL